MTGASLQPKHVRRFFGVDMFISHAHADAGEYAVALASRLSRHYAVYVDRFDSRPGKEISEKVARTLLAATMLIVVASPDATTSQPVRDEIARFRGTDRPILVIDVDGAFENSIWRDLVEGLSRPQETAQAMKSARPTRKIERSIRLAFRYVTRSQRLWRSAAAAVAVLVASIVATAYVAREASQQRARAAAQRLSASAAQLWVDSETPPETVLRLAAESLRRSPTPEAYRVITEVLPLVPSRLWTHKGGNPVGAQFSPDGRWIVERSEASVSVMTDAGRNVVSLDHCRADDAVFAPDAPLIAFSCTDEGSERTVFVDAQRGTVQQHVRIDPLSSLFVAAGDRYLVQSLTPDGGFVEVRRRSDDALLATWPGRDMAVGGNLVAVRTSDTLVELRDVRSPARVRGSLPFAGFVNNMFLTRDDRLLVVCYSADYLAPAAGGGVIATFDVSMPVPRELGARISLADPAKQLVVSDDGSQLAVSGGGAQRNSVVTLCVRQPGGGFVRQWSRAVMGAAIGFTDAGLLISDRRTVSVRDRGVEGLKRMHFVNVDASAVSRRAVLTIASGETSVWRVPRTQASEGSGKAIAESGRFALLRGDRSIAVRDLTTGESIYHGQFGPSTAGNRSGENGDRIDAVALSSDGSVLAIGFPFHVRLYATRTGIAFADRFEPAVDRITTALGVSRDGRLAASAGVDGVTYAHAAVRVSDVRSGRILDVVPASEMVQRLEFTDDGSQLLAIDTDGRWWRRDLRRKRTIELTTLGRGGASIPFAIARDGRWAVAGVNGAIQRWDLADARWVWTQPIPEGVFAVATSEDGSRVAIVAGPGAASRLRLLDARTGALMFDVWLPFAASDIAFSGSTNAVAILGQDGETRLIEPDAKDTLNIVCTAVGRSLTKEEWSVLVGDRYVDTCADVRAQNAVPAMPQ